MKVSKSLIIGDLSFKYIAQSRPSLGFIVSKYYGNAIMRNLFKRRCRFLFRNNFINRRASFSIIVRPKKQNLSFIDIDVAFRVLYEKICS